MSDLTLPGSIPGLLRGCSPVRDAADPDRLGVVIGTGSTRGVLVAWCWDGSTEWRDAGSLSLDLTDATGRAHAAWWLAAQKGFCNESGCAWFSKNDHWTIENQYSRVPISEKEVPSLRGLDPGDPWDRDYLPDGSRRVDAEALRLVVLHVAGVTP